MRLTKLTARACVAIVILMSALPADAQSSEAARRRRDSLQRERAGIAAQINTLEASDRDLEAAVATLDEEVSRIQGRLRVAEYEARTADAAIADARAKLAVVEEELENLRRAAIDRAVRAYADPRGDEIATVLTSRTLSEAARRQALLRTVTEHGRDVADQLRAAREDRVQAERVAREASTRAASRRDAVRAELARAADARAAQRRLRDALDRRIQEFQAEADALGREAADLAALAAGRSAARASRSGGDATDGRTSGAGLIWPLRGPVTSEYGPRWGRMHEGIDISASSGTPIRAAKAGEVIYVGQQGGYGNITLVDHGGGLVTAYPHQSRFGTREGAVVAQGEVIGFVGCTGSCTGPHLHFETRVNGAAQNPRRYLP